MQTGEKEWIFEVPATFDPNGGLSIWGPDSRSRVASDLRNGTPNLWEYPLFRDAPPKQFTHFDSGTIFNQHISPDGELLVVSKGTITRDAVLFTDEVAIWPNRSAPAAPCTSTRRVAISLRDEMERDSLSTSVPHRLAEPAKSRQ